MSQIKDIERDKMETLWRILKAEEFHSDLVSIQTFIKDNYDDLHFRWGVKNKLKLAAERIIRFHVWRNFPTVKLYNTPHSSDIAIVLSDCVLNIDCKTVDLCGNQGDSEYLQFELNQSNFYNEPLQKGYHQQAYFSGFPWVVSQSAFFNGKPVLNFFVTIYYRDNSSSFEIDSVEACCLPHKDVVSQEFDNDIIQNYKTYKYMDEIQALKIDPYFCPRRGVDPSWVRIGNSHKYIDLSRKHPFDSSLDLIWGLVSNKYKVCVGGQTARVKKEKVEYRTSNFGNWIARRKLPFELLRA